MEFKEYFIEKGDTNMSNRQEYIRVDTQELKDFRIISAFVFIIWFFFGEELIEIIGFSYQWVNFIMYLISYYIPYLFLKHILYKLIYSKRINKLIGAKNSKGYIHIVK